MSCVERCCDKRYIPPRNLAARNRCVIGSICFASALPDLYGPPFIEEEKHFIHSKATQSLEQQLNLFMVTRIWACKDPSRLPPPVSCASDGFGKSTSRNDLTVRLFVDFEERRLRPIRTVDSKGSRLVVEKFENAFRSLRNPAFVVKMPVSIPGEKLFYSDFKVHPVIASRGRARGLKCCCNRRIRNAASSRKDGCRLLTLSGSPMFQVDNRNRKSVDLES